MSRQRPESYLGLGTVDEGAPRLCGLWQDLQERHADGRQEDGDPLRNNHSGIAARQQCCLRLPPILIGNGRFRRKVRPLYAVGRTHCAEPGSNSPERVSPNCCKHD